MESTESRHGRTTGQTGATRTRTVPATGPGSALADAAASWLRGWPVVRTRLAAAGRTIAQTVTPAGWLVVVAASAGLGVGWAFGWVEWIVAGLASLVLVVLAVPFLLGRPDYDVDLGITTQRVVAGSEVSGAVRVANVGRRSALPGRLEVPVGAGLVELALPLLRPGRAHEADLVVPAARRGIVTVGPVTAVRADPVGVFRREIAFDDVHDLYVHPRTVAVPSTSVGLVRDLEGTPTRQLVDSDVSFHAIRPYVAGDSRRQIHWKSTARTGDLMVRQYEESRRSRIAVVLSCAADEYLDDDEFELAVSAAASISLQAIRDGRDLEVMASAEVPEFARSRVQAIRTLPSTSPRALLDGYCTVAATASTMPLGEVCRLAAEACDQLSLAVLVCGSPVGLRTLRQAALAFPVDAAVIAVVCDERARPTMRQFGSMAVLTVGVLGDLTRLLVRGAQS
ncbi:MAG: DUF58 domain-containing protein [Propionicimonas sp.]|uniref:DUF58 domain-containing protein n=1 Tax=Propionicimonas sp. TaxID=1955623 RepID=UPI003D0E6088